MKVINKVGFTIDELARLYPDDYPAIEEKILEKNAELDADWVQQCIDLTNFDLVEHLKETHGILLSSLEWGYDDNQASVSFKGEVIDNTAFIKAFKGGNKWRWFLNWSNLYLITFNPHETEVDPFVYDDELEERKYDFQSWCEDHIDKLHDQFLEIVRKEIAYQSSAEYHLDQFRANEMNFTEDGECV